MNLHEFRHLLCTHVLEACSGKMTLHTQRTLHNCDAPSGAGRTEIKQVLHPVPLKISLFRRGWRILDCACEGDSVMSVRRTYATACSTENGTRERVVPSSCLYTSYERQKKNKTTRSCRQLASDAFISISKPY